MQNLFAEPFSAESALAVIIIGMSLLTATLISVTGIVFGVVHSITKNRAEVTLKREMVARGMSADEIVRVVNNRTGGPAAVDGALGLTQACEAVVEGDGEWHEALVLQAAPGRYFVHFVGTGMDENEWVGEDRVRFPAGSQLSALLARTDPDRNGAPRKGPVEAEV